MSIIKNEIPILEFDTEQTAVINPTHENIDLKLPKKCVFAFLGEHIEEYASKTETRKVSEFVSATKLYPIYITLSHFPSVSKARSAQKNGPAPQRAMTPLPALRWRPAQQPDTAALTASKRPKEWL